MGAHYLVIEPLSQGDRAFNSTYPPEPIRVSVTLAPEACRAKGSAMQLPPILQGESITRLLQGAFVGFAATAIIGFTWGGWTLGKTAKDMADKSAATAVVTALAPICVDKFQHDVDAKTNLTELMKVSSWQQGSFVQKGGWATLPGGETGNSALAQACANLLTSLK
jgi:hypothetical protein